MRKETTITIDDRGNQLTFKIKEMPATKFEAWLTKALLLLAKTGADIGSSDTAKPDLDPKNLHFNILNALTSLDYADIKPLLDDMLTCCVRVEGSATIPVNLENADSYIQDVKTLFKLRWESLKFNLSFLDLGDLLPTQQNSVSQVLSTFNMRTSAPTAQL